MRLSEALPFAIAVRRLVDSERLKAARTMLETVPANLLNDSLILRLRRVLAPPIVSRTTKTDVDREPEYDWLRTEGHNYRGQWVALLGRRLLAVAPTLRELRASIRMIPLAHPPLIQRVEARND
jgi:hypothetical protein